METGPSTYTHPKRRFTYLRLCAVLALACAVSSLHFFTPVHTHYLHLIYDRLCYLPIILSAYWFGLWGGISMGVAMSLMHLYHIEVHWGGSFFDENLYQTLEACVHSFLGIVTGLLSERFLKASEKLEQSYKDLQEKTRQVLNAENQLKQTERIQALAELSAGAAHEIRTPLASIKGAAEILASSNLTAEQREEFTNILLTESKHLNNVVHEFLNFARPKPQVKVSCNLQETIEAVLDLTEQQRRSHNIRVSKRFDPELPGARFDPDRLKQVFVNLITNAIQAMPNGGEICITGKREGPSITCTVDDEGTGIPESILPRVFDPFFTTRKNGTGLGLSIVYKIVHQHSAEITAQNRPEGGARFRIVFPGDEVETQ